MQRLLATRKNTHKIDFLIKFHSYLLLFLTNRESRLGTPIPGDSEMMKVGDDGFFALCLGVAPSIWERDDWDDSKLKLEDGWFEVGKWF